MCSAYVSPVSLLILSGSFGILFCAVKPLCCVILGEHIYLGALRLDKFDASVMYTGYGPPYCTIYITYSTVGRSISNVCYQGENTAKVVYRG